MKYDKFSQKQIKAMLWWKMDRYRGFDAIVCDGSVRSGKTLSMTIGFILWSLENYQNQNFAICGKTIASIRRNIVMQLKLWLGGICEIVEHRSQNYIDISIRGKKNRYFIFGGRDESSYSLIQGMTLAGVLLDEVALMPQSFVDQALARCSVQGSKFWFNCNPENPNHWFHREWVEEEYGKKNRLHLHFTMDDNLNLTQEVKQRYESIYTGVFYERYVLGLWFVAEGAIYPMFREKEHLVPCEERKYDQYYISCDYGTMNPFSAGLWGRYKGVWYRVKEYYHNGRASKNVRTDEQYYKDLETLAGNLPIRSVIVDPSAASFIACIRKHGRFNVTSAENDVLNGIRNVATCLQEKKILFNDCCKATVSEFKSYVWDEKSGEDKPIKENDHAMDDIRYFVNTVIKPKRGFITAGNLTFR